MKITSRTAFLSALLCCSIPAFAATPDTQTLFQRLSGRPILKSDARYNTISKLLSEGKALEAAHLITEDEGFYNNTVRHWASVMSSREETPLEPINDFIALIAGAVRDGLDARTLLTGNFRYEALKEKNLTPVSNLNNTHFEEFEAQQLSLKTDLVRVSPQWMTAKNTAGLLTTRAWAKAHYLAGTNRRATEFAFREFLCLPIDSWKTPNLPDLHVRQDVDRAPGGDPNRFQTECRTCHAGLDAMSGAFAEYDFKDDKFIFASGWIAPKFVQNADVFPKGYRTQHNGWMNLLSSPGQMEIFGWRTSLEGAGAKEFATMIAESKGFSQCMVKRVFKKLCRREIAQSENKFLSDQAIDFEKDSYNLRTLFEKIAITENCIAE